MTYLIVIKFAVALLLSTWFIGTVYLYFRGDYTVYKDLLMSSVYSLIHVVLAAIVLVLVIIALLFLIS